MNIKVFLILLIYLSFSEVYSQDFVEYNKDCATDTVLVLNSKYLCDSQVFLSRTDILDADSIFVNKTNLSLYSCVTSSFTLGNNFSMNINGQGIPLELKKIIASTDISYKFIYLKNIVLIDERNNISNSTFNAIKISFID